MKHVTTVNASRGMILGVSAAEIACRNAANRSRKAHADPNPQSFAGTTHKTSPFYGILVAQGMHTIFAGKSK